MTALVPADQIERIVGAPRHRTAHYGRAVTAEQTVYILHSHECLDREPDLRSCRFSVALDRGIEPRDWFGMEDRPVALAVRNGWLVPTGGAS